MSDGGPRNRASLGQMAGVASGWPGWPHKALPRAQPRDHWALGGQRAGTAPCTQALLGGGQVGCG